tara:strand:- start:743 stop:1669 length:927 start_codon:yes stop_codon:yes gene_type:complete
VARRSRGRPVDGILILDKPIGPTSNKALQAVKNLYFAAKAGHTGSLDPMATGVLPICFGEATKFSQYLLDADKIYKSTFLLGITTASGDAEGEEIERKSAALIDVDMIEKCLANFRGEIEQVPPMFSALKYNGTPLYKLARQGKEVERAARKVTIYQLDLCAFRPGELAELDVYIHCSKGTYVRSLAEEIGKGLDCGAHVTKLRRIKAGPFDESISVNLEVLEILRAKGDCAQMDDLLMAPQLALGHLPEINLSEDSSFYMRQGQPVMVAGRLKEGLVRMSTEEGEFIGLGEVLDDGRVMPRRLIKTH